MSNIAQYLWIGTVVILLVGLAQAVGYCVQLWSRIGYAHELRRQQSKLLELQIDLATKRRIIQEQEVLTWAGWRKFELVRKEREDEAAETFSFYLKPHDGKPIPRFNPGQFLTLRVSVPGQARPQLRCYSLSDCSRPDHYRLTIKRVRTPQPGIVSSFLCSSLDTGAILDVQSPSGHFYLDTMNPRPSVLIGGGVGVTPMLSMLNAIAEGETSPETWFFYGVRNRAEHMMKDHILKVAATRPHIRVRVCYSAPTPTDVVGVDYHCGERVTIDLLKRELPSLNYDFYMCGPGPMMNALTEGLRASGVPDERVHTETFGPSAGATAVPVLDPTAASGPEIEFRRSKKKLRWNTKASNLWSFAKANGVEIPTGCMEGNCGSCLTAVVSGEVTMSKAPGFSCEKGTCLPCCCVPKDALVLDA